MAKGRGRKWDKSAYFLCSFLLAAMISVFVWLVFLQKGKTDAAYLKITVEDEEVAEVSFIQKTAVINWQRDKADRENFLFLPAFADLSRVYVQLVKEGRTVYEAEAPSESTGSGTDKSGAVGLDGTPLSVDAPALFRDFSSGVHEISVGGDSVSFTLMQSEHLDTILIELDKPLSYLEENKENVSGGRMEIYAAGGRLSYRGSLEKMSGHGNSTWYEDKKSFALKLSEKAALFGEGRSKKYLLVSNVKDGSFLRNKLFYDMADKVGLENTPACQWADLYVNGSYQGMYLLTEKIDVSSGMLDIGNLDKETKEINALPVEQYSNYTVLEGEETVLQGWNLEEEPADISGGYLLELDYPQRYAEEPSKFRTRQGQYIVIKSPDYASAAQAVYIYEFVQAFEDALYAEDGRNATGKGWQDYIDEESFVKRYVLDEISMNIDAGHSSTFFYKPRHEDRLYAGPVWDYDIALGNAGKWGIEAGVDKPEGLYVKESGWSAKLYETPGFYQEVTKVYEEEFDRYLRMLGESGIGKYEDYIRASAVMDNARWSKEGWEKEVAVLRDFLEKRRVFLEESWMGKELR